MLRQPLRTTFIGITVLFWIGVAYHAVRTPPSVTARVQGVGAPPATRAPRIERKANLPIVTAVELARHARPTDCWIAIAGTVYDLTDYVDLHPSKNQEMEAGCGKDGTAAWDLKESGKEKGQPHTKRAAEFLAEYPQVGALEK